MTNDELIKAKKELINFFSKNAYLKYQIIDCYLISEDYFEGITRKKDELNALIIYKEGQKNFYRTILDCLIKSKIKKFLEEHDHKIENILKDEICCICYDKKISKMLVPCKHNFCAVCAEKLREGSKCPICRSEILCVY